MTLVDSSAWIELFRATGSPTANHLRDMVRTGEHLATTEPVLMELLAGAANPEQHRRIRAALASCRVISLRGPRDWEDGAAVYRACRQRGGTPRKLLDCLIAAAAIRAGVPVLSHDRDFELIARHTSLRLAD